MDNSPDSILHQIFQDDQNSPEILSFGVNSEQQNIGFNQHHQQQHNAILNQPSSTTSPGSFSINSSNPVVQYSPRNNGNIGVLIIE